MKILSFNVNDDYRNIKQNAFILSEFIKNIKPDIIGLQEVNIQMYNELYNNLNNYYNFSDKGDERFFNVLLYDKAKLKKLVTKHKFINSSMNRHYLILELDNTIYITTHLESAHINSQIRQKQIDEIFNNIDLNKNVILFGDLNFTNMDEDIKNLNYLNYENNFLFTYDSKFNDNATPPYRSNLDRFYININKQYNIKIINSILFSDHFPVLLNI
jgi:exonuclease III